ncbi:hypothetical protein LMG28138_05815 [Pararobbsia alpina]|uniref:Uncharacterized protein n=1 Tax=Pararobbsia alpina TaxID=621374 RepID=A0A6S7BX27_9BURK|nr:hypothetical protein LMG28138_05815 [Pararobbsia alpina]
MKMNDLSAEAERALRAEGFMMLALKADRRQMMSRRRCASASCSLRA